MKKLFGGGDDPGYLDSRVVLTEDPTKESAGIATDTKIAVRDLGMKGKNSEKTIAAMDEVAKVGNKLGGQPVFDRIKYMNGLYQTNVKQVAAYADFLKTMWEIGRGNEPDASTEIKTLLETPELS